MTLPHAGIDRHGDPVDRLLRIERQADRHVEHERYGVSRSHEARHHLLKRIESGLLHVRIPQGASVHEERLIGRFVEVGPPLRGEHDRPDPFSLDDLHGGVDHPLTVRVRPVLDGRNGRNCRR